MDYVDQFRVCSSNGVFRGLPEEGELYIGEMHREILRRLEGSVRSGRKPMSLLTGEVGAGKTTLAAVLHERLRGEEFSVVHVLVVGEDIDLALLKATRIIEGKPDMRPVSESALEAEFVRMVRKRSRREGRRVVLILDDVQELSDRSLAELRDILNRSTTPARAATVILVGNNSLLNRLGRLPRFASRVGARVRLEYLSPGETARYLAHRMKIAGHFNGKGFSGAAVEEIHEATGGCIRLINMVARPCVDAAYEDSDMFVPDSLVRRIVAELPVRMKAA